MSAFNGCYKLVQATIRTTKYAAGNFTLGRPFPSASDYSAGVALPSVAITASSDNAASIFIYAYSNFSAALVSASNLRKSAVPLTAGQTFTFTALQQGSAAIHDIAFGTGYTYISSAATPMVAVISYLKRV